MKRVLLALAGLSLTTFALQTGVPWTRPVAPPDAELGLDSTGGNLQRPRIRTLWKNDFIRHTMSLATGRYGLAVQDNVVVNVDSELDYGVYFFDQFFAGIQGGQVGELLDLGTTEDLAARYGYQETVGGGQGFSSIRFENGGLVILADLSTGAVQEFTEGQDFLDSPDTVSSVPAQVNLGHIYLVRIQDRNDPTFLRFAKLLVTEHVPDEQVTVLWEEIQS